jgi:hypothetical protein
LTIPLRGRCANDYVPSYANWRSRIQHLTTTNHPNIDQSRNLKDFLVTCHLATADLVSLAESLARSVLAAELEGEENPPPDAASIELLAERIVELHRQIEDRI